MRLENFIPIRKSDLVELICRQQGFPRAAEGDFRQLCRMLEATFHFEYHTLLEQLKDAYAPFDPDADTRPLRALTEDKRQSRLTSLFDNFARLLERANFRPLARTDIEAALTTMSDWGINLAIDFTVFDRLEVYARGDSVGKRTRRRWRNFLRVEEVELPVYQRLVIMFRLRGQGLLGPHRDAKSVYIKVFKDIPHMDLEMLLPGTSVRMSRVDRARIFLPTVSGLAISIWKIVKGALVLLAAGFYGMLAFLGLVGGTIGYGVRSYFGYVNRRQKYQLSLTESLYYQNLDNNAGVLFRLLDEAEEQECREAILAYYFLWQHAGEGWTESQLDRAIEGFLEQTAGCKADFEVHDALAKLRRLGLVQMVGDQRLTAKPIHAAMVSLDAAWDGYFHPGGSAAPANSDA